MLQIDFLNGLDAEVRNLILRIALAALALLLIWLLRRMITRIILLPLRRMIIERTESQLDDILMGVIETPIRYLIIALGISVAGQILLADSGTVQFVGRLSRTFVIIAVAMALYNAVDLIVQSSIQLRYITGVSIDEQLLPFMRTALKFVIIAIAIIVVLQEWRYDVNGLVAGLGLSGLAFSLAAKDTAANLFAFTTIVSDRPFVVGEFIKTPDVEGIVEEVGSRNIRIRQLDQAYVTVPNATIAAAPILNWSRLAKRRISFTLGITYAAKSADIRALLDNLREMLKSRELVDEESVVVYFTDFGDSALHILIVCMVLEPDWGLFTAEKEQINLAIMDIVEGMGLSFAFPSQSLYIENLPPLPAPNGSEQDNA